MKNTILGIIFIGLCAFSIVQSRQAMGVSEDSRSANTEISSTRTDRHTEVRQGKQKRNTASGKVDCYMQDGYEVCDDNRAEKSGKIDSVPSDNVITPGTEQSESSERGNK